MRHPRKASRKIPQHLTAFLTIVGIAAMAVVSGITAPKESEIQRDLEAMRAAGTERPLSQPSQDATVEEPTDRTDLLDNDIQDNATKHRGQRDTSAVGPGTSIGEHNKESTEPDERYDRVKAHHFGETRKGLILRPRICQQ